MVGTDRLTPEKVAALKSKITPAQLYALFEASPEVLATLKRLNEDTNDSEAFSNRTIATLEVAKEKPEKLKEEDFKEQIKRQVTALLNQGKSDIEIENTVGATENNPTLRNEIRMAVKNELAVNKSNLFSARNWQPQLAEQAQTAVRATPALAFLDLGTTGLALSTGKAVMASVPGIAQSRTALGV